MGALLIRVLLLLVVSASTVSAQSPQKWEKVSDHQGVVIHKRPQADTGLTTYRGVGFVDAGLDKVAAVVRDITAYSQWLPNCRHSLVLQHLNRNHKVYYQVMGMPWWYQKRDLVVAAKTDFNWPAGLIQVETTLSDQPRVPQKPGFVRMKHFTAQLRLAYFGRDKTRVTQIITADPGDNLSPKRAERLLFSKYPRQTIVGLRKMAGQKKYAIRARRSPENLWMKRLADSPAALKRVLIARVRPFLVDPELLNLICREKRLAAYIYGEGASFDSLRRAIKGVFYAGLTHPAVGAYLAEKSWDEVVSLAAMIQSGWLMEMVFRDKTIVRAFLQNKNRIAEKIWASAIARNWILTDSDLEAQLAANPSLRRRLLTDTRLHAEILQDLPKISGRAELTERIKRRVAGF